MDVALDTFPFNGATTTAEALYMAVPVIGLDGPRGRHVARVCQSLLRVVGLGELVGADHADFAAKAAALIRDRGRVGHLRRTLREQVLASPLCDAPALARQVEATYREYWRAWCARQREGKSA
jgi:predicted O-linked N-acetylglucosamine transferase (SPINDLY family)